MARLGQFRRDTLANWQTNNPVIADGEFVLIAKNSSTPKHYDAWVCGDGITAFNSLFMFSILDNVLVVQEPGTSTTSVMSQRAVTEEFNHIYDERNLEIPVLGTINTLMTNCFIKQGETFKIIVYSNNAWNRFAIFSGTSSSDWVTTQDKYDYLTPHQEYTFIANANIDNLMYYWIQPYDIPANTYLYFSFKGYSILSNIFKLSDDNLNVNFLKTKYTSFIGVNLFDKNSEDIVMDHYIANGGYLYENSNYFVTPFIDVHLYKTLYFEHFNNKAEMRTLLFFDENKNYITEFIPTSSGQKIFNLNGVYYIRGTGFKNDIDGLLITNLLNPIKYIPYAKEKIDANLLYEEEQEENIPEIVLPSVLYIYNGIQNSIYHENYLSYKSSKYDIDKYGGNWDFYSRCFRITSTSSSTINFGVKIFRVSDLYREDYRDITTLVGDPSINNAIKINCIGDSFTYNGAWFNQIYTLCPNTTFVGMRRSYNTDSSLRAEGRGGWTLDGYFDIIIDPLGFSPFMHPNGYKYYGTTNFWKRIHNNNIGSDSYTLNGFDDYKNWFDSNGYKVNPSANDLMYDSDNEVFKEYNGSSWINSSITISDFTFNYSTYLSVWQISSPDFVLIMLGVNDYFGGYNSTKASNFNTKMDIIINSIHSVLPSVKIGICTNTTKAAYKNSNYYNNEKFSSRYLFLGRKNTIQTFDTDEYKNNNVFVVDTGICLDPDYGFGFSQEKPFEFYEYEEKELFDTNGVHPSTGGYKQLGTCAAGFIQVRR